ncbi:hypothetical protein [Paraburkholderia aromaticivorans]|uniref:hypothetical protein n=1 Tax=Paraburkholderia aromaticivorans TaxID=2026199 RepID=UPI001455F397|nr:hypothetical protein [Paraburkholderia aromaticivorans]
METVENIIKFLSLYPRWAKLLIVGCIGVISGTLIYAPRSGEDAPVEAFAISSTKAYLLVIEGVLPFSQELRNADVRVTAFVNGMQFRYPTVAGVEWMGVDPNGGPITHESFRLPRADEYEIRFEMESRDRISGQIERCVSQQTITIDKTPFEGHYEVFPLNRVAKVHESGVVAEISFSIEDAPQGNGQRR